MSSTAGSMSMSMGSTRSDMSQANRRAALSDARAGVFEVLRGVEAAHTPTPFIIAGTVVQWLQLLSFAFAPQLPGHHLSWSILYFSHLPFWDGSYNGDVGFLGYVVLYWICAALVLLCIFVITAGVVSSSWAASVLVNKLKLGLAVKLATTTLTIPILHAFISVMVCNDEDTLWLFKNEACSSGVVVAHMGIAIVLLVLFFLMSFLVVSCVHPATSFSHSWIARPHTFVDRLNLLFRLCAVLSFHLLLSRNMISAYAFVVAAGCFTMAALNAFVLPCFSEVMNRSTVVVFSVTAWVSCTHLIDAKVSNASLEMCGGYYAILLGGSIFTAITSWILSGYRYSSATKLLLSASLSPDFVSREHNPFAMAVLRGDPNALPFPRNLPHSDTAFSQHRFLESEVLEEFLRNEAMNDMASGSDEEGGIERFIDRVQVISPMVEAVHLPTDGEVASRFLVEWVRMTGTYPTPHMLNFAVRIHTKTMMKFPNSPTAVMQFVMFVLDFIPSVGRMGLCTKVLEGMSESMLCDFADTYRQDEIAKRVKRQLGVRDHTEVSRFTHIKQLHRDMLVRSAALWKLIEERKSDIVTVALLAKSVTEHNARTLRNYREHIGSGKEDEMIIRNFGLYLQTVMGDTELSEECFDEASNLAARRRAKLMSSSGDDASAAPGGGARSMALSSRMSLTSGMSVTRSAPMRATLEKYDEKMENLEANLNSSSLSVAVAIVTMVLIVLVAALAGIVINISLTREETVNQLHSIGRGRTVVQQSVYLTQRLIEVVDSAEEFDLVKSDLTEITKEVESIHNALTHGSNRFEKKDLVKLFELPSVRYTKFLSNVSSIDVKEDAAGMWDMLYIFIGALHRTVDAANSDKTLMANATYTRFILDNGPSSVANIMTIASERLIEVDEDDSAVATTTIAAAVGVTIAVLIVISFVFLWNFRRAAMHHVNVLNLFTLIPKDTAKRICTEAKENMDKFVNGGIAESEVMDRTTDLTNPAASPTLGDDNDRRTSVKFSAKLIENVIHAKSQEVITKKGQSSAAGHDNAAIVSLIGNSDGNEASQHSRRSSNSQTSVTGDKRVSFMEGGLNRMDSTGRMGGTRRASISLRRVKDEFGELMDSDDDDDMVTIPNFNAMESSDETTKTATTNDGDKGLSWSIAHSIAFGVSFVFIIAASVLCIQYFNQLNANEKTIHEVFVKSELLSDAYQTQQEFEIFGKLFSFTKRYDLYRDGMEFFEKREKAINSFIGNLDTSKFTDFNEQLENMDRPLKSLKISNALAATVTGLDGAFTPEVDGLEWKQPPKDESYDELYGGFLYDPASTFAYDKSADDRKKTTQERSEIAKLTVVDQFFEAEKHWSDVGYARAEVYLLDLMIGKLETHESNLMTLAGVALALAALGTLSALVFVSLENGRGVRTAALIAVCIGLALTIAIGVLVSSLHQQRVDEEAAFKNTLETRLLAGQMNNMLHAPLAFVQTSQAHFLEAAIANNEDIDLTREEASLLLPLRGSQYDTLRNDLLKTVSELKSQIAVALHLSADRYQMLSNYSEEVYLEDWDITEQPFYEELALQFPKEVSTLYTNKTYDNARNLTDKGDLALTTLTNVHFIEGVQKAIKTVVKVNAEVRKILETQFADAETTGRLRSTVAYVCGILAIVVVALWLSAISIASIQGFTSSRRVESIYEAMFSAMTIKSLVTLAAVGSLYVIIAVVSIVFSTEVTQSQKIILSSSERSTMVALGMSVAEEINAAHDVTEINKGQVKLRTLLQKYLDEERDAYFRFSTAVDIRSDQNELLFGPDSTYSVRDVRATGLSTGVKCFDTSGSNGNIKTAEAQYLQFVELIVAIANYKLDDAAAAHDLPANEGLHAIITEARQHFPRLLNVLAQSDEKYVSAVHDFYSVRRAVQIALLVLTVVIVFLAYVGVLRPIILELTEQESGAKLLLSMVPADTRASISEINDFFEGDGGGKDDQLKKKLQQSEKLLQNILPPLISRRLKNGEVCIADTHEEVTVVFAALIGFDEYSARMKAQEIVMFLNDLIVVFDHIVDLLELEKIKTIGDVYFLCGGLTPKTKANHALLCMESALLFQEALLDHNQRHQTPNLMLRIGVNTDPAVAGVIGSTKVAYDLWGDSVNTASRMQSTGLPGRIQVSHKTYLLKDIQEYYSFEGRQIEAKGKGLMETHLFEARKKPSPFQDLKWRVHR